MPKDARQHRNIHRLLVDLVVHVTHQIFIGIDGGWHAHGAMWVDAPGGFIDTGEAAKIHSGSPYTSTTQAALQRPLSSLATLSAV